MPLSFESLSEAAFAQAVLLYRVWRKNVALVWHHAYLGYPVSRRQDARSMEHWNIGTLEHATQPLSMC